MDDPPVGDPPVGQNAPLLGTITMTVLEFFRGYAWNVIAVVMIGAFLWVNLEPYVYDWLNGTRNKKDLLDTLSSPKMSWIRLFWSGPERVETLMSAHDKARQKMQEDYDRKIKKKKESNSTEVNEFAALVRDVPSSSGTEKTETKTKAASKTTKFKSDLNPLLGRASFDPPRYRPGASRYSSRGGGGGG